MGSENFKFLFQNYVDEGGHCRSVCSRSRGIVDERWAVTLNPRPVYFHGPLGRARQPREGQWGVPISNSQAMRYRKFDQDNYIGTIVSRQSL